MPLPDRESPTENVLIGSGLMKITFIIPFIVLTGGIKAPMEYANQLHDLGHHVILIYPRESPYLQFAKGQRHTVRSSLAKLRGEIRYWASKLSGRNELRWFDLRAKLIRAPDLSERYIPDGDIVVAVDWTTAEWVNKYGENKGKKFYLIQGYEIWSGPKDRVEATWTMPLEKIVISSWLKKIAEKKFGQKVHGPLIHGVDHKQFYNDNKVYNKDKRIGMMYHDLELKGVSDGIKAFEIAKEQFPNIQLVMVGVKRPRSGIPSYVEFHANPSPAEMRKIYCSCDIWLCPSRMEGGAMTPQEAMACKCAVVTTNVGAVLDYAVPGETALVSPPNDPEALARNLIRLLSNEEELKRISIAGYEKIKEFTWEKAAKQMESFFYAALQRGQ